MQIDNHRLAGASVTFKESPNCSGTFAAALPDTLVIHFTGGASFESSVSWLCNPGARASAHVVVGRAGQIAQLVPFDRIAWHAGISSWQGRSGLNQFSLGIELDNAGRLQRTEAGGFISDFGHNYAPGEVIQAAHRNAQVLQYWHRYTAEQIDSCFALCELLIEHYGIKQIVGHEEIAPARKIDPGPAFPLDRLRQRLLIRDRALDTPATGIVAQPVSVRPAIVTASLLNVRSGAGATCPVLARLRRGTQVRIADTVGGWSRIETPLPGWLASQYVA